MRVDWESIAGGTVRRTFKLGSDQLRAGTALSREQIMAMPVANRNALFDKQYFDIHRYAPGASIGASAQPPVGGINRFVQPLGGGKFNVIEGRQLNAHPLTSAEAYTLAGLEEPPPARTQKPKDGQKRGR